MYRGSTPTHEFILPAHVMELAEEVRICYEQKGEEILLKTLEDCERDGNILRITLTQEEANLFERGTAQVQLRVKTTEGKVIPSDMANVAVRDVLDDEVM